MAKKSEVYREKMSTKSGKIIMVISRRGQIYSATPLSETGVALPYANCQSRLNMGNGETEADVIKRTIARSNEKYELSNKAQTRQHTDYTAAFNILSPEERDRLCPPQWRAASTRKAALVFYIQNTIPLIQKILDADDADAEAKNAQATIAEIVRNNQAARRDNITGAVLEQLNRQADRVADQHIYEANLLYEASRHLLPQYDLIPIHIPRLILEKVIPPEQCKALPRSFLIRLSALFRLDLAKTPLAAGAIIMLCCLTRPAETCPKFGEILDCGSFGVYGVLSQSDGSIRIVGTKTMAGNRLIILPRYAMDAIREHREQLEAAGLSPEEIANAYVVSRDENPFRPAKPQDLSHYIRTKMELLGCKEDFWRAVSLLSANEPDFDAFGNRLGDLCAYILRRSGCTFLVNCTSSPAVGTVNDGAPYAIIDVLMGHKLLSRTKDDEWSRWVAREDNWPLIAQMMESIILDPDHSAHPAYTSLSTTSSSQAQVCHVLQRHVISAVDIARGEIVLQARCRSTASGRVLVHIPSGASVEHVSHPQGQNNPKIHGVDEIIDKSYYDQLIASAKEISERRND